MSMAVPTTHARSSGHQVRRTHPSRRAACLGEPGRVAGVNRHPMLCLVDRLEPCALRLAGVRKARDPDCEVHNLGNRRETASRRVRAGATSAAWPTVGESGMSFPKREPSTGSGSSCESAGRREGRQAAAGRGSRSGNRRRRLHGERRGRALHTPQARRRGCDTERGRVLLVSTRPTGKTSHGSEPEHWHPATRTIGGMSVRFTRGWTGRHQASG
jgi:hypothetical protein